MNTVKILAVFFVTAQSRWLYLFIPHVKFFYRNDYNTCKSLVESLNTAIIEAIRITEDEEFVEKNRDYCIESICRTHLKVFGLTEEKE